jgi:copper chaperone
METLKFKTNINCGSCVASVTPFLNEQQGIEKWEVNTANPDKILTVACDITPREVMDKVKKAGFRIEQVEE